MKKLFALVMVLAMALAIAVPAMASGWDQITPDPAVLKNITVEITALEVDANTSVLGELYEQLSVMYPVVKGTDVHFYVEITIPAEDNLSQANQDLLKNKGLQYKLKYDDTLVQLDAPKYYEGTDVVQADAITWDTEGFDETNEDEVYGIEYTGEGLASGDVTFAATIFFENAWDNTDAAAPVFDWDNDADGIDEFIITHTIADKTFLIAANGDDHDASILFTVDGNGKIDVNADMIFHYDADYVVTRAVNGDITFKNGATNITPASTAYAAMKSSFDAFFTALGFGYADAKYMTEDHFDTYFGTISTASASITYPSGTVVVTEPTVTPPQTGDATTVAGFVMIALALVAAAAVTVKKVRA